MLSKRILSGFFVAVVLVSVFLRSGNSFFIKAVSAVFSVICTYELFKVSGCFNSSLANGKKTVNIILFLAGTTIAVFIPFVRIPYFYIVILVLLLFVISAFSFFANCLYQFSGVNAAAALLLSIVSSLFLSSMVYIREKDDGFLLLGIAFLTAGLTDIFAFLVGRNCGKKPLIKAISPNKTIEGALGGILWTIAIVSAFVFIIDKSGVLSVNISYIKLIIYLFIASVVGQLGDLSFSLVKRVCKVKDFGNLIPGHGGFLDRADSLILVLPFTYLFFTLF